MEYTSHVYIRNCSFLDNLNREEGGGALKLFYSDDVVITESEFLRNQAGQDGGSIFVDGTVFVLNASVLGGNTALNGGAIFASSCLFATVQNTDFFNNTALSTGGVFGLFQSDVRVNNSIFIRNSAVGGGGGVVMWDMNTYLSLDPVLWAGNDTGNVFSENIAMYGPTFATAGTSIKLFEADSNGTFSLVPSSGEYYALDVRVYSEPIPPLRVVLYDRYGSQVTSENNSMVAAQEESLSLCNGLTEYLTGDTTETTTKGTESVKYIYSSATIYTYTFYSNYSHYYSAV